MAEPEKFVEWVTGQPMALVEATNSVFRTSSSQSVGLVPTPPNPPVGKFLRDNATWAFPVSAVVVPPTERIFTTVSTQEYSYPAGCVALWVKLVAGGGAGGGVPIATALAAAGAGGGPGGYSERLFLVSSISTTVTILVGDGGVGITGAVGSVGGSSSFGIYIEASGGGGGGVMAAIGAGSANFAQGGAPGGGTNGTINGKGVPGESIFLDGEGPGGMSGGGGSISPYGAGGAPRGTGTAAPNLDASMGTGYGAGGGGPLIGATGSTKPGANGTSGFVYIMELYQISASS